MKKLNYQNKLAFTFNKEKAMSFFLVLSFLFTYSVAVVEKASAAASGSTVIVGANISPQEVFAAGKSAITSGATLASKYSNLLLANKETILDTIAYQMSRAMIRQMRDGMIRWIQSGYNGKPSFLVNPEQMLRNMAAAQAKMVLNDVSKFASNSANGVSAALIKDIRNSQINTEAAFQKSITSTMGITIKNSICSAEGFGILMRQKGWTDSEAATARKALCESGMTTAEQQEALLKQCFAENFKCGGWKALLDMTQNSGRNTSIGQLTLSRDRIKTQVDTKAKQSTEELNRGNGFFNIKECVREKRVTINGAEETYCDEYQSTSPGQKAVSLMGETVTDPIKQARLADEINESVSAVASAFMGDLVGRGFSVVNEAVNNLNQSIASGVNDINKSINKEYTNMDQAIKAFTQTNKSTPAPAYNQTNLQIIKVEPSAIASIVRNTSKGMTDTANANDSYLRLIDKELALLAPYVNAIDSLDACYNSIASNSSNATMVKEGRDYIADRRARITSIIPTLIADKKNIPSKLAELKKSIAFITSSTDANAINAVYQAYSIELDSGNLKKSEEASIAENKYDEYDRNIYGPRDEEGKPVSKGDLEANTKPKLVKCQCAANPTSCAIQGGGGVDPSIRDY